MHDDTTHRLTARSHDGPDEGRLGRTVAIGSAVGFVLASIAVTLGGIAGGIEAGSALGLGLFIGMWGGTGFGVMVGAAVSIERQAREAAGLVRPRQPASSSS